MIFHWKSVKMASHQAPGHSKPLILVSQQPPGDSQTISISLENIATGFTAVPWRTHTINHGFAAASWRFQNHYYFNGKVCKLVHNSLLEISNHESADSSGARACGTPDKASNPPTPPELERVRPQTRHRSQPATFLNQHAKRPPEFR